MLTMRGRRHILTLALAGAVVGGGHATAAPSAGEIDRTAAAALNRLYASQPAARMLGEKAVAILIFPEVTKAGLMIGGELGYGALKRGGRTVGYYRTHSVSYGLQAGAQRYSYALFLMNEEAVRWLNRSDGWEIGSGPSVTVLDQGMASRMSSTTLTQDVYGFVFGQTGLMAGIGLQGTKISRYTP
jgi:lipid-binding SYLF domain-containing protein